MGGASRRALVCVATLVATTTLGIVQGCGSYAPSTSGAAAFSTDDKPLDSEPVAQVAQALSGALTVGPLDQNSQFALIRGVQTGANATLKRNNSTLVSQVINDLDLTFAPPPQPPSSPPGNLTDASHVVLQGTFTGGGQSELIAYNGSTGAWWVGASNGTSIVWTDVQNTTFGNVNDGNHTWWVGDFEGSGRQQVLLYNGADGSWRLGVVNGTPSNLTLGSMTWTTVANTASLGWGNLNTSTTVYTNGADFKGAGTQQIYVYNQKAGQQYLGVANAAGTSLTFNSVGTLGLGSFRDGHHVLWTGNFSGGSQQQILFYNTGNTNWYLGSVNSAGTTGTWKHVATKTVANVQSIDTKTFTGNFTGSGEAELLVWDLANGIWTIARMSAGALTVAVASTLQCDCVVSTGNFSGAGRTEILAELPGSGGNWGQVVSPTNLTIQWTYLPTPLVQDFSDFVRAGNYTTTAKSEVIVYDQLNAPPPLWTRGSLDGPTQTLSVFNDASTGGLPPLINDAKRMLFAGPFDGGGLDEFVGYDSVSGSYWLGRFDGARVALPSLLTPGDSVTATVGGSTSPAVTVANNATTEHYNNARSGVNAFETALTPTSVLPSTTTFGVKQTYNVSYTYNSTEAGHVFAQPLFVHNVAFSPPRNVVYVATEAATVYAFDANATGASPPPLVSRQILPPGEVAYPAGDLTQGTNIAPLVGLTGTPVIDAATQTMYVVTKSKDASGNHHFRLHALDLVTLLERAASPVELLDPTGVGQENFVRLENQRAALLLDQGTVWVVFGGHHDADTFFGYVTTFDARTLALTDAYETTSPPTNPTYGSGIWMNGAGPSAQFLGAGSSRVFMSTGNVFAPSNSTLYLNDSVLTFTYPPFFPTASWTPINQSYLSDNDLDLSASAVVPLPNNAVLVGGKQGYLYVVDQSTMSCVAPNYALPNGCVLNPPLDPCGYPLYTDSNGCPVLGIDPRQQEPGGRGAASVYTTSTGATLVYWAGADFQTPSGVLVGGRIERFIYNNATRQLSWVAIGNTDYGGAPSPVVAANGGSSSGLVWLLEGASPVQLVAYDMAHLSSPEHAFPVGNWTCTAGGGPMEPTVMDGKVYVGYSGHVGVLGL